MGLISLGSIGMAWGLVTEEKLTKESAFKWQRKAIIPCILGVLLFTFIPSKSDCYKIWEVAVLTAVVKENKAIQELPGKSFEALNRFLDSVAKEEKQEEAK